MLIANKYLTCLFFFFFFSNPNSVVDFFCCCKLYRECFVASAHIITVVIGSGVLSLAWDVAQFCWIAGPILALELTEMQKVWRTFEALGAIAFAYSYSLILIEIQVTLWSIFHLFLAV
ncbi:hypothetical protein R3W88_011659 [Solanum pinnatisectum]|uniref:Uncharacterized protein n=1 Tax=Solanum pinnatisectum TaxID=50273 RepID=A0AAV9L785_9SOLN|nr:hypothetical protein R3W88_011659 [Solanum pinnatisectum]